MQIPLYLTVFLSASLAAEPVPGAWEHFSSASNAGAWSVNDFRTGKVSAAQWLSAETGFVAKAMNGVPGVPCGIWFFTGSEAGEGAMVGDFHQAKIRGIRLRYFVSAEELGEMDCAIYALGPAGSTFYYSGSVLGSGLSPGGAWRTAEFGFNTDWYYVEEGAFRSTPVTPQMLATVSEIGFRFLPKAGITTATSAGIDDVVLVPTVEAPQVLAGSSAGNFTLGFTPRPGTACTILKSQTGDLTNWQAVTGQESIAGSSAHLFQTPRSGPKAFYRVEAAEYLTPVVTP